MTKSRIHLLLTADLIENLKQLAVKQNRSTNNLIELVLKEYVNNTGDKENDKTHVQQN